MPRNLKIAVNQAEFDTLYDELVELHGCPVRALFQMASRPDIEPHLGAQIRLALMKQRYPAKRAVEVKADTTQRVVIDDPTRPTDIDVARREAVDEEVLWH